MTSTPSNPNASQWVQLSVCTEPDNSETLEEGFMQAGALAITFQDSQDEPIFEPEIGETPLWSSTQLTALFQSPIDIDHILATVQQHYAEQFPNRPFPHWQVEKLADKDWEREWLNNYQPLEFGPGFWVVPSWLTPPEPDKPFMRIDPGLAFGTGTHETTSLCLSWMTQHQSLLKRDQLHLLDYGCGSGILAIASVILGASTVTATDIDPQALFATQQNSQLNSISSPKLNTLLAPVSPSGTSKECTEFNKKLQSMQQADVIVANILCEPLLMLSELFKAHLSEGGRVVFSGILATQVSTLQAHYQSWITFDTVNQLGDWALISGSKIA